MAVEVVRATYTEQTALETFLANIFGRGGASVIVRTCHFQPTQIPLLTFTQWRRGRFQCTIPRKLTEVCASMIQS